MENKRKMTAPNVSVGADTEQPIFKTLKVVYPTMTKISRVLKKCRGKCS